MKIKNLLNVKDSGEHAPVNFGVPYNCVVDAKVKIANQSDDCAIRKVDKLKGVFNRERR